MHVACRVEFSSHFIWVFFSYYVSIASRPLDASSSGLLCVCVFTFLSVFFFDESYGICYLCIVGDVLGAIDRPLWVNRLANEINSSILPHSSKSPAC